MPRPLHGAGLPAHLLPIVLGAVLIAAGIGTNRANAQSFPCRSAHYSDEKTVCSDPGLGQLDQHLADVYRRVMLKLPRRDAEELDKHEDLFVTARRRCGENRACIEQSYRNRIQELQSALPEGESDWKAERRALSKGTDPQQASTPDRGTEDQRGEPSDTTRASPEAVVSSPLRPSDQGEATAAPALPAPPAPAETRSRRDETTGAAPNPPTRHEAEAAVEGVPVREKHSRHTRRTESVATAPAASDQDKTEGTSASERRTATSGSTTPPEPARSPEKRHSKLKTATVASPRQSPAPADQAKPASQPEIKWVNPAPSQ